MWWMTTRKEWFGEIIGHLDIWSHRTKDSMHQKCGSSSWTKSQLEEVRWVFCVPTVTDNCWEKRDFFKWVWIPVGRLYSYECAHTPNYVVIKYLDLMGFKSMRIYFLRVWIEEWIWQKLDGRSEDNLNTVYNIFKLITKFIKISFCFTSVFNFIFWWIISSKVLWTIFFNFVLTYVIKGRIVRAFLY